MNLFAARFSRYSLWYITLFSSTLCFVLCISSTALADVSLPPQLTLKPDSEVILEGRPILLNLSIVHSFNQPVAAENIICDEKILSIQKIGEEVLNPNNIYANDMKDAPVVTRFRLTLPAKSSGIATVGPIHLKMGLYVFDSNAVTINVQAPVISPSFQLKARLLQPEGGVIYTGQVVTFEYRLIFSTPMKLIKEELPLLHPNGFLTQGSPEVVQYGDDENGSNFMQIIQQKAIAQTPGTYEMGISTVEGLRVSGSETIYPIYRAIAPSFTVSISPFPISGRPDSFYGAVGSYAWRSRFLSQGTISLGDSCSVEYRASGRGDLTTVVFPPKEIFSGLQEAFIIEEWPREGKVEENTKTFIVRIRPRRSGQLLIPGFAISSFDPASKKYLTSQVLPLSVNVRGVEGERETEKRSIDVSESSLQGIVPVPITIQDLKQYRWGNRDVLCTAFLLAILAVIQWYIHRILVHQKQFKEAKDRDISAKTLFEKAIMAKSDTKKSLILFRKAIFRRLAETGFVHEKSESIGDIVEDAPILGEAKSIIERIDQALYQGRVVTYQDIETIQEDAIQFYHKMKGIPNIQSV